MLYRIVVEMQLKSGAHLALSGILDRVSMINRIKIEKEPDSIKAVLSFGSMEEANKFTLDDYKKVLNAD
jgi:hypothetical protein